jgi:hypothetical protein
MFREIYFLCKITQFSFGFREISFHLRKITLIDELTVTRRNRWTDPTDPTFFHLGSRIRTVSIPDPGSRILDPHQRIKYFNPQKSKQWFLSSKKFDPGCSSRIPDPDADFLPSWITGPGGQKGTQSPIPDPGSGSAALFMIISLPVCRRFKDGGGRGDQRRVPPAVHQRQVHLPEHR